MQIELFFSHYFCTFWDSLSITIFLCIKKEKNTQSMFFDLFIYLYIRSIKRQDYICCWGLAPHMSVESTTRKNDRKIVKFSLLLKAKRAVSSRAVNTYILLPYLVASIWSYRRLNSKKRRVQNKFQVCVYFHKFYFSLLTTPHSLLS
jgi:hypothetical protein